MTVTATSFLDHFPEFADASRFPVQSAQYWIDFAVASLDVDRWGTMIDYGVELYAAHNLALQGAAIAARNAGGIPGESPGVVSAEAVDKVSVSYDATVASIEGAADFNLTRYGVQFLRLARMFGAGGVQL